MNSNVSAAFQISHSEKDTHKIMKCLLLIGRNLDRKCLDLRNLRLNLNKYVERTIPGKYVL